ncbi:TPA: hypothetical protein I0F57_RS04280 [Enterococcus faecalis]|nr:predicted protein [Enterococcus faecalis E1Sol]EGO8077061.1 hypothetical protein [Enterococcus faecalis]EGO8156626.1 hypothetical protein [Enterococcus faecalis]EGO8836612.1 hypothetical protein [Enterococcus faecalis]EGO9192695.1 hypothetical protein [Enterococcus faecalis]
MEAIIMNGTVTIISNNLSYKQAIFSLLALNSLPEDFIGNQVYRDTVEKIIAQTLDSLENELTIIESLPNIEGSTYF